MCFIIIITTHKNKKNSIIRNQIKAKTTILYEKKKCIVVQFSLIAEVTKNNIHTSVIAYID